MTADRTIPTILLVSFLVIAIPAALYFRKLPNAELTPSEKELIDFSNKPVAMSSARAQVTFSGLVCPVKAAPKQEGAVTAKAGKPVSATNGEGIEVKGGKPVSATNTEAIKVKKSQPRSLASRPSVSMIYSAGSTRMAVIDGQVVQEGSALDGGLIVTIDETRVLIRKSGKDIWLTTE